MDPTARTHDICLSSYHIKDLAAFGKSLSNATVDAFPKNWTTSRYKEVHVLLLSWEEDNLGVKEEIIELEIVLKQGYRYETEHWKIPSARSHNSLAMRLSNFLDQYERKDSLLIVYYGGHGYMSDSRQCVWSCTDWEGSPTVQWSGLQTMLEQAASDVLILLDCCAAASSAADAGKGVTELLAACGFETWAPGVGEHSFTRSLIDELKDWIESPSLSIVKLHSEVLARIKYWKPRYSRTGNRERRKTPIYICLANEGKQRSIQLHPLKPQESLSPDPAFPPSPMSSLNSSSEDLVMSAAESSRTSLSQEENRIDYKGPKVLISVALEEDQLLQTNEWLEWLESVPAFAKAVHVEGIYKADSSLLLLVLPVEVWDMLEENKAVQFLAFVNSRNLLGAPSLPPSKPIDETSTTRGPVLLDTDRLKFDRDNRTDCQPGEVAGPMISGLHVSKHVPHVLDEYNTIFLIDDSVESPESMYNWAETKKTVMMSAEYVLERPHRVLRINFLTSRSTTRTVFGTADVEWMFCTRLREFRQARPYQRIADFLDSHIDSIGLESSQGRTYPGLNVVVFLDAEKENILDGEISAIVARITTLSAASVEVGVQFVHLQRDSNDGTYILRQLVLVAGRGKKHWSHGIDVIRYFAGKADWEISERIVTGAIADFPKVETTSSTLNKNINRKSRKYWSRET